MVPSVPPAPGAAARTARTVVRRPSGWRTAVSAAPTSGLSSSCAPSDRSPTQDGYL
jgi:hypothetical protein